jgi:hypothetical protein
MSYCHRYASLMRSSVCWTGPSARRNYGIYAIDSTANSIKSRTAQDINDTAKSALLTALNTLKPLLRPVLNSIEAQTASGGGTPLAPNGAFDT